ncbi:twin-arginine translocation pathway signal sequence domain-containing protein [Puniceibacterium antarcticum]|uniref:Twin-arginine translocation pathway signal sequence domain-containing protein n=1 Tax=Puniceibacterium antarcticum TaxID=1206336 RepID=A0A2G8RD62_9RHOB|nr:YSC84-related protein [Puniceibacterium antarcticum]PIL19433.1 twin-arginine translocation pathway signal sequence domain-containing protein [Puniceibacterium antarcticum]
MTVFSRRGFTLALGATGLLAACNNGVGSNGAATIDARVDATLQQLYSQYPNTRQLESKSTGTLVMPLVTEVGLGFGGAYGRGALRVGGVTVDYYSTTKASAGLQIGAQQYAHVLFFMTEGALMDFRRSPGWAASANVEYATPERGETLAAETTTSLSPVIAIIFGQSGLRVGATLDGVKYSRIIP